MALTSIHHGFTEAGIGRFLTPSTVSSSRISWHWYWTISDSSNTNSSWLCYWCHGPSVICNVLELCRLNFANSHRWSSLSPPSRGDQHLIWLIALLYWYADKCYWKIVAYIDIWLDIDIWLEIVYCSCCDIIAY